MQLFKNIVGNNKIKESLENAINSGNVSHSYLFVGKEGVGKKLFAKDLAKKVMCLGDDNCESCIKFDANSNPDFSIIVPDGKSIKIDQIRNNCLLKTLEEPPEYAMIILIASNETKMLQTIKSRCVIIRFEDLTNEEISKILNTNDQDIIKLCEGSVAKAETISQKKEIFDNLKIIANLLGKNSLIDVLNNSDLLYSSKDDIMTLLDFLNIIFFEKTKENLRYSKAITIIEETKKKILSNNNYDMCIDYMLMHIWEDINDKSSRS